MQFRARFYDGITATPHEVTARFDGRELRIPLAAEEGGDFVWPVSAIQIVQHPQDNLHAILCHKGNPNAELHIFSKADFAALRSALPRKQTTRIQKRYLVYGSLLVALLVLMITVLIPAAARNLKDVVPYSVKQALGDKVYVQMSKSYKSCAAPEAITELAASFYPDHPNIRVGVMHWRKQNAFALPGGRILFTHKLLQEAESRDEIIGIMAHEVAHIAHNDSMERLIRIIGNGLIIDTMTGGASLAYAASALYELQYNREQEQAADEYAMAAALEHGFDTRAMAGFFERMMHVHEDEETDESAKPKAQDESNETAEGGIDWSWLNTHPQTQARLDSMIAWANTHRLTSSRKKLISDADWEAFRKGCM